MNPITRAEYDKLTPRQQGYYQYMQGDWPGSELKTCVNQYPAGSSQRAEWDRGQMLGVQSAQDSEE